LISKKISLDPSKQNEISGILKEKNFIFLDNDHAFWRAKSKDLSVIFYKNGSLLLQGNENSINRIIDSFEGFLSPPQENNGFVYPVLGLDESGKGDYFGPLVLGAAILDIPGEKEAAKKGVMDSKKISDRSIIEIYHGIKDSFIHETMIIEPPEYNYLYKKYGNLNILMTDSYLKLVRKFQSRPFKTVILDKFSQSEARNSAFRKEIKCETFITEKGERFPAVAAASIFARYSFIEWIENKSAQLGFTLPKGCGSDAARLFLRLKSELPVEKFESLAKSHFKAFKANKQPG
jgi:ribonuclease HIII